MGIFNKSSMCGAHTCSVYLNCEIFKHKYVARYTYNIKCHKIDVSRSSCKPERVYNPHKADVCLIMFRYIQVQKNSLVGSLAAVDKDIISKGSSNLFAICRADHKLLPITITVFATYLRPRRDNKIIFFLLLIVFTRARE